MDKDTEGLLLVTDDGALAHRLLSPARHVEKTYYVETDGALPAGDCERLRRALTSGKENAADRRSSGRRSAWSAALRIRPRRNLLTITEGKYHQVKRMMQSVGRRVTYLRRISHGAAFAG